MLTVHGAPTVGTGPKNKGGEILEPPILTTPLRINPWFLFPYGGIEVDGARNSTSLYKKLFVSIE